MTQPGRGVALRWAVRTKLDGDAAGYRVTADDGRGTSATEYAERIRDLLVGTPSATTTGTRDALPWVVVGPIDAAGGLRAAVLIQEWPARAVQDRDGRPVTRTRYFDMRWEDAAESGYRSLFTALSGLDPAAGAAPVIAPSPLDPSVVVRAIRAAEFQRLAWAAAAVLDGPVVLKSAQHRDAGARLAVFDQIQGLLPRALRAGHTVATWSTVHAARMPNLSFGDHVPAGGRVVDLDDGAALPALASTEADAYYRRLCRLQAKKRLDEVADALWAAREVGDWASILAVLDPLDPGAAILDKISLWPDRSYVGEVRAVLGAATADQDVAHAGVAFLLSHGGPADLDVCGRHWSSAVCDVFVRAVLDGVIGPDHATMLDRTGHAEDIQVALFHRLERSSDAHRAARAIEFLSAGRPPAAPALHEPTRHPKFAQWILGYASSSRPEAAAAWLRHITEPPVPAWAGPFRAFIDRGVRPAESEILRLSSGHPWYLLALLANEVALGVPGFVLESPRICAQLGAQLAGIRSDRLLDIAAQTGPLPAGRRAALDILIVRAGGPATDRLTLLHDTDRRLYLAALGRQLEYLDAQAAAGCARQLITGLLGRSTVEALGLALEVAHRVPAPVRTTAYREIANRAGDGYQTVRLLAAQPEPVLAELFVERADLGRAVRSVQLEQVAAPDRNGRLADRYAVESAAWRAAAHGAPSIEILRRIRDWIVDAAAADVYAVFRAIAGDTTVGNEVLRSLIQDVLRGTYGGPAAERMDEFLPEYADGAAKRVEMLRNLIKNRKPGWRTRRRGNPTAMDPSDATAITPREAT